MHRTLKEEMTNPPQANLSAQQKAFNRFVEEYNFNRPHEALDMKKPGTVYVASNRDYTSRSATIKYGPEFAVRTVRSTGEFRWNGKLIYISQALSGERIGLQQLKNENEWEIMYGFQRLGIMDDYSCSIKV